MFRCRDISLVAVLLSLSCSLSDLPFYGESSSAPAEEESIESVHAEAGAEVQEPSQDNPDAAWYNRSGLKAVFGDFEKTEPLYLSDPTKIRELADRGQYLVQGLAACGSCHGANPTDPATALSGGRVMRDRFGLVAAPNITPDSETGIGSWNIADIVRAVRSSIDAEGRPISLDLHSGYRWLSDRDAKAIAVYLLASSPVRNEVERRRLGGFERNKWGLISQHSDVAGYVPVLPPSSSGHYGRYLAANVARCQTCHTADGGLTRGKTAYAGGVGSLGQRVGRSLFTLVQELAKELAGNRKQPSAEIEPFLSESGRTMYRNEVGEPTAEQTATSHTNGASAVVDSSDEAPAESAYNTDFPLLGPDIRGTSGSALVSWDEQSFLQYLDTGKTPQGETRDGMLCPWPFFQNASEEDKVAIAKFLKSL